MRKTEECLQCRKCWERKPISEYYENKYTNCKECLKKYAREYDRAKRRYKDASLFDINETQVKKQKDWKVCSCCWIFKSLDDFNKVGSKLHLLRSVCKECQSKYYKERYRNKIKETCEQEGKKVLWAPKKYTAEWRLCSWCNTFKEWDDFYKDSSSPTWYMNVCKKCRAKMKARIKERKKKESKIKTFFKKLFRIK